MLLADKIAMLTSGEYSLTKKNAAHDRKSILFVKLTDSAQRVLSNYLRNLNSCEVPIIEFNNDEGRLLIPTSPKSSADTNPYMAQFKFDLISNDTMQGKQGRFECVEHRRGSKQLLKYGHLTQRLRIHANEDVYETTKNRMAAIELQQRKNCTIQLDWNSTTKTSGSLNRKLKLTPKGFQSAANSKGGDSQLPSKLAPRLETSNMIRNKSRPVSNAPPKKINPAVCLIRKPLKERIVHLLAIRPYKRPELEAVLKQDGLRDCDRSRIMDTLMSVSTFRDNTYHLSKHAWNEVQEDWLFYTEQERQQVRKNKMQYLNSSSSCSSSSSDSGISVSSNHSPSNNHSGGSSNYSIGSPPQAYKRPGYFNGADGFQTKRQRISHFSKQDPMPPGQGLSQLASSYSSQLYDDRPSTDDYQKTATSAVGNVKPEFKTSPFKNSAALSTAPTNSAVAGAASTVSVGAADTKYSPRKEQLPLTPPSAGVSPSEAFASTNNLCNGLPDDDPKASLYESLAECDRMPSSVQMALNSATSTTASHDLNSRTALEGRHSYEKPKYMKDYVTITNTEQRSSYKEDFSKIFEEYKMVHKEVDRVRNLFAKLGDSLKKHKKGSKGYAKVENDILTKYYALKNNRKFQDAKRRYEYLHEKLSHIKNLVSEYDDNVRRQM